MAAPNPLANIDQQLAAAAAAGGSGVAPTTGSADETM